MLRPERRGAPEERRRVHQGHRQQLPAHLLQLRAHAARLDGAERSGDVPAHPGGRRRERAAPRARQRHRAGVRARNPPADERPRPPDADPVGAARFSPPVRPARRGHVAAGDRRGPRDAARAGRRGPALHGALPAPGPAGAGARRRMGGRPQRPLRSDASVQSGSARRAADRGLLLRRPDRARHRLRRGALQRRGAGPAAGAGFQRRPDARRGAHRRRRRRDVRPPQEGRRRGPGRGIAPPAAARGRGAGQPGPGARALPARARGGDRGRIVVRHIRDRQRDDLGALPGACQPPALDPRQMLADDVHFADRSARAQQRATRWTSCATGSPSSISGKPRRSCATHGAPATISSSW